MKKAHLIVYLLLFISSQLCAQDLDKYNKGIYTKGEENIQYRILYPENFSPNEQYPIVFFLHGSGERGDDNQKQLVHGGAMFLKPELRKQFPAIVVFPQCPEDSSWANLGFVNGESGIKRFAFKKGGKPTPTMQALIGMIESLLDKPFVNKKQVYVGGLSMGGMGTFELLRRKPKMFAAAFSICGGDNIANVKRYRNVPLWIFHGGKDNVVPSELSKQIADHLKIIGKEVKYTLYADANHNSWDAAFAEPQLLPWLFSHQKN